MSFQIKEQFTFEQRKNMSMWIRSKHPGKIPVIIEKASGSRLGSMRKTNHIVANDMSVAALSRLILEGITLPENTRVSGLCLFAVKVPPLPQQQQQQQPQSQRQHRQSGGQQQQPQSQRQHHQSGGRPPIIRELWSETIGHVYRGEHTETDGMLYIRYFGEDAEGELVWKQAHFAAGTDFYIVFRGTEEFESWRYA